MRPHDEVNVALRSQFAHLNQDVLGTILGHIDVGVMLTDLEHTTLAVNSKFGELFGICSTSAVTEDPGTLREAVSDRIQNVDAWLQNLNVVYADPELTQEDVLELQNPFCVLARRTVPVIGESGIPKARLWTFRDVTQVERTRKLRELLHEMSLQFDPDPKVIYDRIVRRLSEFYGSTAVLSIQVNEVMEFRSIASPIPGVEQTKSNLLADSYCQFCLEAGEPIIIQDSRVHELHNQTLPARLGLTRYAGSPILSPQGSQLGTLCILDDRSDEVHTTEDLRVLSLMAMRVSSEIERERELRRLEEDLAQANSQLIQSEKLAVVGTLAASIAHDIRNIVSVIALDMPAASPQGTDQSPAIRTHIDRFLVLSQRLLSYARPKEVTPQAVELPESVQRVMDLLARHCEVAKVDVLTDFPDDLLAIRCDPSRLDNLFINLVLNAIQASSSHGEIKIRAWNEGEPAVIVEVSDTGTGMTPEQAQRAFEPFHSSRSDGFGLGLFSCRQIMNECGGTIAVAPRSGGGTVFTLRFAAW